MMISVVDEVICAYAEPAFSYSYIFMHKYDFDPSVLMMALTSPETNSSVLVCVKSSEDVFSKCFCISTGEGEWLQFELC